MEKVMAESYFEIISKVRKRSDKNLAPAPKLEFRLKFKSSRSRARSGQTKNFRSGRSSRKPPTLKNSSETCFCALTASSLLVDLSLTTFNCSHF